MCLPEPRAADLPSPQQAEAAARRLLAGAGMDLTGADVQAAPEPAVDLVTVNPAIGGVATIGMASSIAVGPKGVIEYAEGWLGRPVKLGDYPLVGAQEGFKRLQAGRSLFGGATYPLGAPQSGYLPATTVTGARLALVQVVGSDGQGYLEPAYLFVTAAGTATPPVPAVADGLLKIAPPSVVGPTPRPQPAPAPGRPGIAPGQPPTKPYPGAQP